MPDKNIVKEYTNGDITIVWKPGLCAHSTVCWKGEEGLSSVFDPNARPWINPEGASNERIMQQIDRCPSGALAYYHNSTSEANDNKDAPAVAQIKVNANGPLIIQGKVAIQHLDGREEEVDKAALCRCGASSKKPFCDGSHHSIEFKDA